MTIEAVIGANYGDEGKGLFTEYLCRNRPSPLVVLSNGGCQRGHTVYNSMIDVRHVFHHFGSGTLFGAPTLLSKTFLLNPMMFIQESMELLRSRIVPICSRMQSCVIQLPSDMFINQQLEKHRSMSGSKHGSCGWGIWETTVRNKDFKPLLFEEFLEMDEPKKMKCLNEAFDWQIENRLRQEYENIIVDEDLLKTFRSTGFCKHFIDDCIDMSRRCPIADDNALAYASANGHKTIVIENAQGLLLDKKYAPVDENGRTDIHTTPSKTGLEGALEALGVDVDPDIVIPNYITRTYITRHGAGPFPEETAGLKYEDKTNQPNDYQDSMRFGKIDYDAAKRLLSRTQEDAHSCGCVPRLVLTHMNEARCSMLEENANYMSYEDDSAKIIERKPCQ